LKTKRPEARFGYLPIHFNAQIIFVSLNFVLARHRQNSAERVCCIAHLAIDIWPEQVARLWPRVVGFGDGMTDTEWLFDAIADLSNRADDVGLKKVASSLEGVLDDYLREAGAKPGLRAADLMFGRTRGRGKADVGRRCHLISLAERRGSVWVDERQRAVRARRVRAAG